MNQNPNNPYDSTAYGSNQAGPNNPNNPNNPNYPNTNYPYEQYAPTQAAQGGNYPPPPYQQPDQGANAYPPYQQPQPNQGTYPPSPYGQPPANTADPYAYPAGGPPTPTPTPPPYGTGGGMQQPPPATRPSSGGRRVALFAVIGLVVLAILIAAIYIPVHNTQVANENATATARVNGTADAHTATAVAEKNATATANAGATATAIVSTYPFSANVKVNDPLTDNSKGEGWKTSANCAFTGGAYHASESTNNTYYTCPALSTNFSNFTYQITMQINKGDIGGITFRGDENAGKNYSFIFSQDGSYVLFLYTSSSSKPSTLQQGDASSAGFKTGLGQSNDIGVVARGSNIDLYVNKQKLASVTDSTLSSGQIGTIVYNTGASADVSFTNAMVWLLS